MDIKLFSFLNKKDKEDTITAIVVVLFFIGLGAYLMDFSQLTGDNTSAVNVQITHENQPIASIYAANDTMKFYTSMEEWVEAAGEPLANDEWVTENDYRCVPLNPNPDTASVPTKDTTFTSSTVTIAKDSMVTSRSSEPLPNAKPHEETVALSQPSPSPLDSPQNVLAKKEVAQKEPPAPSSTLTQRTMQPQPTENKKAAPIAKLQPAPEAAYSYCVVMVGSFKNKENVDKMLQEFKQAGYKGYKINRNDLISVGVYVDCNNPKPVFDKMTQEYGTGVWLLKAKK